METGNATYSATRQRVLELTKANVSPREISAALGISVQRVHQQLTRLRALGELPEKEAS